MACGISETVILTVFRLVQENNKTCQNSALLALCAEYLYENIRIRLLPSQKTINAESAPVIVETWQIKYKKWLVFVTICLSKFQFVAYFNGIHYFMNDKSVIYSDHVNYSARSIYLNQCCIGYVWVWMHTWRHHQMETFSALLALYVGNHESPVNSPKKRPVTRSFGGFFDLRLNKR